MNVSHAANPDHDLICGFSCTVGLDGVWIQEKIKGDIGHHPGLFESLGAFLALVVCSLNQGPIDVDVQRSQSIHRQRNGAVIELDVGIGMDLLWRGGPIPRGGEAGDIVPIVEAGTQLVTAYDTLVSV